MTSSTSRLSEVREYVARMKLSLEEADLTGFARDCHQIRVMLDSIIHSETGTVEPEHLQDAPRVAREKFKVPNPFPHDPKKPEQSEISVVFSSFAACIERETNTLRSLTPSHVAARSCDLALHLAHVYSDLSKNSDLEGWQISKVLDAVQERLKAVQSSSLDPVAVQEAWAKLDENTRALQSASGAVEALRECRAYFERELADDQTLIDGDFGTAYRLTVAALAAAESRTKETP
jgi:hypothetical protein